MVLFISNSETSKNRKLFAKTGEKKESKNRNKYVHPSQQKEDGKGSGLSMFVINMLMCHIGRCFFSRPHVNVDELCTSNYYTQRCHSKSFYFYPLLYFCCFYLIFQRCTGRSQNSFYVHLLPTRNETWSEFQLEKVKTNEQVERFPFVVPVFKRQKVVWFLIRLLPFDLFCSVCCWPV